MRTYTVALFLFLCTNYCLSQVDFKKGYVLYSDGERVDGLISLPSTIDYTVCKFLKDGKITNYQANQIQGYGFEKEDRYFKSGIADQKFVEVIVEGKLSLYRIGSAYYLEKDSKLLHSEALVLNRSKTTKSLRAIEESLGSDCAKLQKKELKKSNLDEHKLIKFIRTYNKCKDGVFKEFRAGRTFTVIRFSAAYGLGAYKINNVDAQGPYFFVPDKFDKNNAYFGGYVQVGDSRLFKNIIFQTGFEYHNNSFIDGKHSELNRGYFYESKLDLKTLSIPLSAIYFQKLTNKLSLTLKGGSNIEFLKSDLDITEERLNLQNVSLSDFEGFQIRKINYGFHLGVGLEFETALGRLGVTFSNKKMKSIAKEESLKLNENLNSITFSITL